MEKEVFVCRRPAKAKAAWRRRWVLRFVLPVRQRIFQHWSPAKLIPHLTALVAEASNGF